MCYKGFHIPAMVMYSTTSRTHLPLLFMKKDLWRLQVQTWMSPPSFPALPGMFKASAKILKIGHSHDHGRSRASNSHDKHVSFSTSSRADTPLCSSPRLLLYSSTPVFSHCHGFLSITHPNGFEKRESQGLLKLTWQVISSHLEDPKSL